jgi:hypothetical protein
VETIWEFWHAVVANTWYGLFLLFLLVIIFVVPRRRISQERQALSHIKVGDDVDGQR